MGECYTRRATASLIKEVTNNVALTPTTFFEFTSESIAVDYAYTPLSSVAGNRAMNLGVVCNKIPAPVGAIDMYLEPKTLGHFFKGMMGVTSGVYFKMSSVANFAVGDTLTNGSTGSGTVTAVIAHQKVLLASGVTGDFAAADTVTNGATGTGTLSTFDDSVYGHYGKVPAESTASYTVQFNYVDSAIRYMGVRFTGTDQISQSDNVMTSSMTMMAQGQFRHAYVTEITTAGAGAKSISVDQVFGLVAADSIKVYRPSTDTYLDFSAATVKTHTIGAVDEPNNEIDITNLETALAVGDLIVLAPQTATYVTTNPFCWKGGNTVTIGDDGSSLASAKVEELGITIASEFEERHAANGNEFKDRFPSDLLQKGVMASGSFSGYYEDETFYSKLRKNTAQAIKFNMQGGEIGSTDLYYGLDVLYPEMQFDMYNTNLTTDDILGEEIPFTAIYNSTLASLLEVLLINDIASY